MTDIVERLLDKDGKFMSRYCKPHQLQELRVEAAAEIERQQADIDRLIAERQGWLGEVERLRAALRECADDLEGELRERYRGVETRQAPRFARDMQPVIEARKLLG